MAPTKKALVIGAGVGGLHVAQRLAASDLSVEIVEKLDAAPVTASALVLHPVAARALEELWPGVLETASELQTQTVRANGAVTLEVQWSRVWGPEQYPRAVPRRDLVTHMASHVAAPIRWGISPTCLCPGKRETVIRFSDGSEEAYAVVIGADGVRSWSRSFVDPGATASELPCVYMRAVIPADRLEITHWRVWRGSAGFISAIPLTNGRLHIAVQAPRDATEDLCWWAPELIDDAPELATALARASPVDTRVPMVIEARNLVKGTVALVGDAAHAVSPAVSFGAALAILDGVMLGRTFAKYGVGPGTLRRYERAWLPHVHAFLRLARLHTAVAAGPHRGNEAPVLRDGGGWFRRLYEPVGDPLGVPI